MDLKLDMYNHKDTLQSSKELEGISDIFDVFTTLLMSGLYVISQFLATATVIRCMETRFSYRICVLIRSTALPSLMCNRLSVVKL